MKLRKQFEYKNITLRIVDIEETYMNGPNTLLMTRVLAPNNGQVPVKINRKQSLKSIQADTITLLDGFTARGADVINELTKHID